MKPLGRRDWEVAWTLSTSLLPLPSSHSDKPLQPFLPCYNLSHTWSRLQQVSTGPNLAAESTQQYIQFLSSGMELHTPSTLPANNWAAINLQNVPQNRHAQKENKVNWFLFFLLCIFSLKGLYLLSLKGHFWKDVRFLSLLFKRCCAESILLLLYCAHCKDLTTAGLILQDRASWQAEPLGLPAHCLFCL